MDSIEPHDVAPDPEPEKLRFCLERIEAALIVLLLALIAAGNLIPRILPGRPNYPISVLHSESNSFLAPIDWTATPIPPTVIRHDLNTATRADLIELPGIGPSLADSILAYREQHGPFQRVEDLDLVTGVGPRKLESVRQFLSVTDVGESTPTISAPAPTPLTMALVTPVPMVLKSASMMGRLNLNTATLEQLVSLPGIGETYAKRILERRRQLGRFRTWADISSVPGVGPKRLENIQRYATIQ